MGRISKKQMAAVEREMQKTRLIFKKPEAVMKQVKALARKINSLSPQNMAVALLTFDVMTASGIHKKGLRGMLESQCPTDVWNEIEPLIGEMELLVEWLESPLETLVEQLVEEFEIETPKKLTVAILNESAKVGKTKPTVKELKLQRFFSFLKIFEEKLASLNIVEDSEITKFLLSMTNAVHRVKIGNRVPIKKAVSKGHGKSLK
jgi:hypothetical protein